MGAAPDEKEAATLEDIRFSLREQTLPPVLAVEKGKLYFFAEIQRSGSTTESPGLFIGLSVYIENFELSF